MATQRCLTAPTKLGLVAAATLEPCFSSKEMTARQQWLHTGCVNECGVISCGFAPQPGRGGLGVSAHSVSVEGNASRSYEPAAA